MRAALPSSPALARCSVSARSSRTRSSMCASVASSSLNPSREKNFIPLSSKGLWEAEITTPASARMLRVRKAIPGVGSGPTSQTSTPIEQIPDSMAVSSMYPESRVSLPMRILRRRPEEFRNTCASARPSFRAVSEVIGSRLATPRTPSVPNSLGCLSIVDVNPFLFVNPDPHVDGVLLYQLHAVRQVDLHRKLVRAGITALGINIDQSLGVESVELAGGSAQGDGCPLRRDPELEVGVPDFDRNALELAIGDYFRDIEMDLDPVRAEMNVRIGAEQRQARFHIGGFALQLEWFGVDSLQRENVAARSANRHHRRSQVDRVDLVVGSRLSINVQMHRQLLHHDAIHVDVDLIGSDTGDAGLPGHVEDGGRQLEVGPSGGDVGEIESHRKAFRIEQRKESTRPGDLNFHKVGRVIHDHQARRDRPVADWHRERLDRAALTRIDEHPQTHRDQQRDYACPDVASQVTNIVAAHTDRPEQVQIP